jgi:hypothetical protein
MKKRASAKPKSSFLAQESSVQESPVKDLISKEVQVKVRRNGLQLKRAVEEAEKELLEQEKVWETPAILRKDNDENQSYG